MTNLYPDVHFKLWFIGYPQTIFKNETISAYFYQGSISEFLLKKLEEEDFGINFGRESTLFISYSRFQLKDLSFLVNLGYIIVLA